MDADKTLRTMREALARAHAASPGRFREFHLAEAAEHMMKLDEFLSSAGPLPVAWGDDPPMPRRLSVYYDDLREGFPTLAVFAIDYDGPGRRSGPEARRFASAREAGAEVERWLLAERDTAERERDEDITRAEPRP